MKKLFSLLLCLCLLFCCCGCGAKSDAPAQPEQEASAPAAEPPVREPVQEPVQEPVAFSPDFVFSTTDRDGNTWDESVFAEHELTMINFWEPWCGPCVGEMPDLQDLYAAYADRGLLILGVYATEGMEDDVDAVLERAGVQYPILHHCSAFDEFDSGYVPTTIFVDREGHVIDRELTQYERDALADVIQALGEEKTSKLYVGSMSYEGWAAVIEGLL
ncbi:MAG: redoxin domain-containing protein [Oscillospiraceae bacterium]|nr:redoxin domain-containing protein [Oscillospiraceae bacterium]